MDTEKKELTVEELNNFVLIVEWMDAHQKDQDLYEATIFFDNYYIQKKQNLDIANFKRYKPELYEAVKNFLDGHYDDKSLNQNERNFLKSTYQKLEPEGWDD